MGRGPFHWTKMFDSAPKSPVQKRRIPGILKSLGVSFLYLVYLSVSSVFGLLVLFLHELFRNPCWYSRHSRGSRVSSAARTMIVDAMWVLLAYVCADIVRCYLYLRIPWPEVDPHYGSTLDIHIKMMVFVSIIWPIILYCLDGKNKK